MAASISFRNQAGARPPRYRTPSPPRHAVEPLSPHTLPAFSRPRHSHTDTSYEAAGGRGPALGPAGLDRNDHPQPHGAGGSHKTGHHSRSGSTIDALATIALATSPTFAPLAYNDEDADNATRQRQGPDELVERPLKRARSERAPSPTWQRSGARPATSHISTFDSMKTDAELLLNFARPSNFSIPTQHVPKRAEQEEEKSANSVRSQPDGRDPNVGLARTRSQSDGSAMAARPLIAGLEASSYNKPTNLEAVVEDDTDVSRRLPAKGVSISTGAPQPSNPEPATDLQTRATVPDLASESGMDTDTSSQAHCAFCKLSRAPLAGGDDAEVTWVNCDGCNRWFHIVCAGFKDDHEIRTVDKFICLECRPTHGPTTFVRKSSRPRTAIDYAGLNQGFVKSSIETPEHHYIRPIKEGKISFLPDNFARLAPEIVTAEYFQHGVGMTEPVVIPSHLNSQSPHSAPLGTILTREARSQEEFDDIIDSLAPSLDSSEEVVDCGQDQLDMVIPANLTVRAVTEIFGPNEPVEVIDVKSQQGEDKRWTLQKWADYYHENNSSKPVRNVISLEVSQSPLGRLLRRPKIVRDLDLQDSVWPAELQATGDYPKVQFYCLMSVADCYTDFHVDFGGSSVFYHILKGKKTFFFIPPKDKHLKKYEEWCNSSTQDTTFLGDQTKECYRVDLSEGDTMLIPSGWIHAVWTPEDSLVIGGNFLTRLNYAMQIKVAKIEKDTKVPMKFRYPFFQKIMWYTALKYLAEDPVPANVLESFICDENFRFYREYPVYYEFGDRANTAMPGSDYYNARFYSHAELDGLPELARFLLRTALIAGGYNVEGVAKEARNAVNRSIPKGHGDPIEIAQKFGLWIAWKRGNEPAAKWTRPGAISPEDRDFKFDLIDKKPSGRPSRRSERNIRPVKAEQKRSSEPTEQQSPAMNGDSAPGNPTPQRKNSLNPAKRKAPMDTKSETEESRRTILKPSGLGPKRVACDACRKRRIRCRHKNEPNIESTSDILDTARSIDNAIDSTSAGKVDPAVSVAFSTNGIVNQHRSENIVLSQSGYHIVESASTSGIPDVSRAAADKIGGSSSYPAKKGRSKACDECRKSKVFCSVTIFLSRYQIHDTHLQQRRCIHDESGRIDPQKAQERSKPRVSGTFLKRASPDDDIENDGSARDGQDTDSKSTRGENVQTSLETTFTAESVTSSPKGHDDALLKSVKPPSQGPMPRSYASPPALKPDPIPSPGADGPPTLPVTDKTTANLVSPPTSLSDDMEATSSRVDESSNITLYNQPSSHVHTSPPSPLVINEPSVKLGSGQTPHDQPRDPSDTSPTTNFKVLISRPEVLLQANFTSEPSPEITGRVNSTKSLRGQHQISPVSDGQIIGHPNQEDNSLQSPTRHSKAAQRDRSEVNTDPESLRLIRELQEQEFGLRKRATRS